MSNKDIAEERGLTPNPETGTYYDDMGNEYRDENGRCLVVEPDYNDGDKDYTILAKPTAPLLPESLWGKIQDSENDKLISRREELLDFFTPNSNHWDELMELLEIERELTKRED